MGVLTGQTTVSQVARCGRGLNLHASTCQTEVRRGKQHVPVAGPHVPLAQLLRRQQVNRISGSQGEVRHRRERAGAVGTSSGPTRRRYPPRNRRSRDGPHRQGGPGRRGPHRRTRDPGTAAPRPGPRVPGPRGRPPTPRKATDSLPPRSRGGTRPPASLVVGPARQLRSARPSPRSRGSIPGGPRGAGKPRIGRDRPARDSGRSRNRARPRGVVGVSRLVRKSLRVSPAVSAGRPGEGDRPGGRPRRP